jgi:hypothetical protein
MACCFKLNPKMKKTKDKNLDEIEIGIDTDSNENTIKELNLEIKNFTNDNKVCDKEKNDDANE